MINHMWIEICWENLAYIINKAIRCSTVESSLREILHIPSDKFQSEMQYISLDGLYIIAKTGMIKW